MGARGPKRTPTATRARRGTLRRDRDETRTGKAQAPTAATLDTVPRDYAELLRGYLADVQTGRIVTCKPARQAVERQIRDVARSASDPSYAYVWSDEHVNHVCAFIERLPHVEGRWRTGTIQLEPVQVFWLALLFGWRHRADPSRRRFVELYLQVGRKAAKSTLMAAVMLYHVLHEGELGAQAITAASTGAQARICFNIACRMVRRAAWLRDAGLEVFAHAITHEDSGSTIKPVNSRAETQDGLNPSLILLDESHAQSFELHDVLKSSQGSRENPLLLAPTTSGYDLQSIGFALRSTALKVLDGVIEADHFLALVYAIDEGDNWRDERVWIKANPLLGVTPKIENLKTYCYDAQATPGLEGEFRVKVCGEWLASGAAWLSSTAWTRCLADPPVTLDDFAGEPCWIGGDLAQLDDIAALALLFVRDGLFYAFVKCYLPEMVIEERSRAVPAYRTWLQAGHLIATTGNMIDYSRIEADARDACARFDVRDIVFDQFGSVQITGNLANDGLPARVEAKNGKTITPAARELETRIKHARIRHDGHPVLAWMVSNCVVRRGVDDSLLPKKEHADSPNKIDAVDALLQAIGGYLKQPAVTTSAYDRADYQPLIVSW